MPSRYLLESSTVDGYLLEDGSGVYLLDGREDASTLTDDYATGTSPDTAKWTNWGGANVTIVSQQLNINSGTAAASYFGKDSLARYSLVSSSAHIQVVNAGTQAALYGLYPIQLQLDANNSIYWLIINGNAQAWKEVAGVFTQVGVNRTHANGDWYRIRESAGTVYYDYSTDGVTWTNQTTLANPFALTNLIVTIFTELTSASTARTAILDNYNVAGSAGTTVTPDTASLTTALFAPTVVATDHQVVTPAVAALTTTTYAPTVSVAPPTATFGKTTDGANLVAASSDAAVVSTATPSSSGTVSSLTFRGLVSAGTGYVRGIIYSDNAGAPGSLLATTDEVTFTNTAEAAITANFTGGNQISITNGTPYWIGVHWKYDVAAVVSVSRDATAGGRKEDYDAYADGSPATYVVENTFAGPIDVYVTFGVNNNVTVTPATAALTTTSYAPTVSVTNHQVVTPATASLTTTSFAPVATVAITVVPGTLALTTAYFAPSVTVSNNQAVTPATASLVTASFAPAVTASDNKLVIPATASLTTTQYVPTIVVSDNKTVIPGVLGLTLVSYAPTLRLTVVPATASLTTTAFAPSVAISNNLAVTPSTATLTISSYAPLAVATNHQFVTPATLSLVTTAYAPVVLGSNQIVPGTASLVLTPYAITVVVTDYRAEDNLVIVSLSDSLVIRQIDTDSITIRSLSDSLVIRSTEDSITVKGKEDSIFVRTKQDALTVSA